MVVGTFESTWIVRVLSLEPGNFMQVLSRQALPDRPESLCLSEIATGTSANDGGATTLFLFAGLANGVLMRIGVDPVSGQLAPDFRTRFLGAKPVRLFKVMVQGQPAVLALSSRSWLCYNYQGRYHITPMSYETLEWAATFTREQCPEGFVSVAGDFFHKSRIKTHLKIAYIQELSFSSLFLFFSNFSQAPHFASLPWRDLAKSSTSGRKNLPTPRAGR